MPKINIYNQKGEKTGDVKLSEKIFGMEVNEALVHQAVVTQMGKERQVLAHTKGRADVRGGGKKPWKQKGTGRARAGSSRSPIWIGGGVTFGPLKTRNFSKKINKKMKQNAIFMVLSDRVTDNRLIALDEFKTDEFKTKNVIAIIEKLEKVLDKDLSKKEKSLDNSVKENDVKDKKEAIKTKKVSPKRSILIVNDKSDEKIKFSGRNISGAKIINLDNINIVDLIKFRNLIFTSDAIKKLEKIYK